MDFFVSDNYINALDWSEFKTSIVPRRSNVMFIDLEKRVETRLGEPYGRCKEDISDETYRKRNCLIQCKNEQLSYKPIIKTCKTIF